MTEWLQELSAAYGGHGGWGTSEGKLCTKLLQDNARELIDAAKGLEEERFANNIAVEILREKITKLKDTLKKTEDELEFVGGKMFPKSTEALK